MRIFFTRHAETMRRERDIDRDWVERTIQAPDQVEKDKRPENVFRTLRMIAERDGRVLRVVYSADQDEVRVITAFFDRARRRVRGPQSG